MTKYEQLQKMSPGQLAEEMVKPWDFKCNVYVSMLDFTVHISFEEAVEHNHVLLMSEIPTVEAKTKEENNG